MLMQLLVTKDGCPLTLYVKVSWTCHSAGQVEQHSINYRYVHIHMKSSSKRGTLTRYVRIRTRIRDFKLCELGL